MPPPTDHMRILFCTDFSANADHAFAHAVAQAVRAGAGVLHLLHVVPEPEAQFWNTYLYEVDDVDDRGQADMTRRIRETYDARLPEGLSLQVAIRAGTPHEEILRFAAGEKIDLIVIGREGRGALGRILSAHVAERVATRAPCPVLVVPP